MVVWLIGVEEVGEFFGSLLDFVGGYSGHQGGRGAWARVELVYEKTWKLVLIAQ